MSPPSRPELHRALGESTRYAVYAHLSSANEPQTINQIAEAIGLHVNTIRSHLDRLREVGLVTSESAEHTKVGRPHHLFSVTPAAMLVESDPFSAGLALDLLTELVGEVSIPASTVQHVGRAHGAVLAREAAPSPAPEAALPASDAGLAPGAVDLRSGGRDVGVGTLDDCADALAASQCACGFEPTLSTEPVGGVVVGFGRCGFESMLRSQPDLACQLHEAVVRGFAETLGCTVNEFHHDAHDGPCWARLVASQPGLSSPATTLVSATGGPGVAPPTDLHQTAHNEGKKK